MTPCTFSTVFSVLIMATFGGLWAFSGSSGPIKRLGSFRNKGHHSPVVEDLAYYLAQMAWRQARQTGSVSLCMCESGIGTYACVEALGACGACCSRNEPAGKHGG